MVESQLAIDSAFGLGCLSMSGSYGTEDLRQCADTIETASEHGIFVLDTADYYSDGSNELLIGDKLSDRRSQFFLSVKTGIRSDKELGKKLDGSPKHIRRSCDESLRRLSTDYIDLYTLAWVDPEVPIEESVGALGELVDSGKIRSIGLSEVSTATLRRAAATRPIAALLTEYSLWERHVESSIIATLQELNVRLWPYATLGRGFLTGKIFGLSHLEEGDWRRNFPRFADENIGNNLALLAPLRGVADRHGATMAQVALAWVRTRPGSPLPIVGCKTPGHVVENVQARDLVLSPEDLDALEVSFPPNEIKGDRYAPMVARLMDTDGN